MTTTTKIPDGGTEDVVENSTTGTTEGGKVGRHCRRFWWAWAGGVGVLVMVVMLILVYGILPAVGQEKVNDTVLTLHSLSILDPKPDSLLLSINSTISGATGVAAHAHLDGFEVAFFLEGRKPFVSLRLPRIDGGESIPVVVTNVTTQVADASALTDFSAALLGSERLRIAIRGRTKLWVGRLNAKVDYNEVVTINGFNQLKGMQIVEYALLDSTKQSDGSNLGGKVMIPNPTVVEIEMGDVHINMSLGPTTLGNGTIPSLTVRPGNNTYDFRSRVDPAPLISLGAALANGSAVALDVRGTGTDVGGVSIPWLSAPLSGLTVRVPVKRRGT